ncbi:hypothetical protein E2320_022494 [Naja naja]|nr:hypothetical protein E2320_022494 [Naja naja]
MLMLLSETVVATLILLPPPDHPSLFSQQPKSMPIISILLMATPSQALLIYVADVSVISTAEPPSWPLSDASTLQGVGGAQAAKRIELIPMLDETLEFEEPITYGALCRVRRVPPVSVCNPNCLPGSSKKKKEGANFCCYDCSPCPPGKVSPEKVINFYSSEQLWEEVVMDVPPVSVCNPNCLPGSSKKKKEGANFCCYDCSPCPPGKVSPEKDSRKRAKRNN